MWILVPELSLTSCVTWASHEHLYALDPQQGSGAVTLPLQECCGDKILLKNASEA